MSPDGELVPADPTAVKRKTPQSSRSWISIDATGQKTVLDADKHEILHRVQIHARDLRILDPKLFYPSAILGRERAIVLNLEHIKAIITSEEVLVRDSSDEHVIPVLEELQRRLLVGNEEHHGQGDAEVGEDDESPFEFRALEVVLEAICSFLAARTSELETSAYPALDELTLKISSRNLERVRKLKSAMTRLTARVQKVRDELEQLLDDDDDMAELYLSRKLAGLSSSISVSDEPLWYPTSPTLGSMISRASRLSLATVRGDEDENDVEELEMLLEAYFMQIDSTLNKLNALREYIDDTEDYINIQLDNHRNQLIQLELMLSSGTVCVSMYSMVAGIFGMNIPYKWNDDHGYIFKWPIDLSSLFTVLCFSFESLSGAQGGFFSLRSFRLFGNLLPEAHFYLRMDSNRDDDFTFSRVAPSDSEVVAEAKELASHVDGIVLKDGSDHQSNGVLQKDKPLSKVPPKEEKVGSLTFTVTDSSSSKQSKESSETLKTRKPITRTKVPFEKGYSQMDWLKLTRTHPDLAGLKGESNRRLITMDEVKQHKSGDSMWTVLKGRVYNISPYMNFHPGGVDMLMKAVGRDGTLLFNKYHAWVNFDILLEKCLVGVLDDTKVKKQES
ncbi:unnamed protein product [Microthlaspi erraticum]|uniref:Magnesium transporter n=1 Tax=Microthlaspi erraticum TaxID=1685480 RepID=A0A6D2IAZ1_9BRAS|nr:unnamed protein product [Microthlaspi erraticum]